MIEFQMLRLRAQNDLSSRDGGGMGSESALSGGISEKLAPELDGVENFHRKEGALIVIRAVYLSLNN